jgi:hypothetical protein
LRDEQMRYSLFGGSGVRGRGGGNIHCRVTDCNVL